jgi:hypothetical protein
MIDQSTLPVMHLARSLCLLFVLGSAHNRVYAFDFDSGKALEGQESDGISSLEERLDEQPDLGPEPGEIRQSHPWSLALSVGESFPGAGLGVLALHTIHDRAAWRFMVARGQRRFSGQLASGQVLSRKSQSTYLDVGYELWPAMSFPFVTSLSMTVGDVVGTASPAGEASRGYRMKTAAFGAEIAVESFFDSGVWLRWVVLCARNVHVLSGRFGNLSGEAMSQVRHDHDGFKLTGLANVAAGYSW